MVELAGLAGFFIDRAMSSGRIKTGEDGKRSFLLILATLFSLIVADGIITQYLVGVGLASEGNPVISFLVGDHKFLYVKILGGLLCGLILFDMYARHKKTAMLAGVIFTILYAFIVYWNLGVLVSGMLI